MKGVGMRLFCLIAFLLKVSLAEETVTSNDLKTGDTKIISNVGSRSGAIEESQESAENSGNSQAEESPKSPDAEEKSSDDNGNSKLQASDTKRFLIDDIPPGYFNPNQMIQPSPGYLGSASGGQQAPNGELFQSYLNQKQKNPQGYLGRETLPNQNDYDYVPNPNLNIQNANQVLTYDGVPTSDMSANQVVVSGSGNQGLLSRKKSSNKNDQDDDPQAYARLIPINERILLHKIPGASHLVTCSRAGELHNFWSSAYQCLVCACIRDQGMLRAVCASCAGCMASNPPEVPPELLPEVPNYPGRPSITERPLTPLPPIEEEVTCKPLPSGQPFDNPLHPCQVCICIETTNMYGKADVHIKCQENPRCVLPTDVTILPPIPDVPLPSPHCDKFPLNVLFPHPLDSCKTCQCSVKLSQLGVPEKMITCRTNPDCSPTLEPEITETPELFPVTPYYPIPEPQIVQNPVSPEPVPFFEVVAPEPSPWTPAPGTLAPHAPPEPPAPPGPLPGPSPHDSCRPYTPNQPFQHPWDECQICVCSEVFTKVHVNIEVNCFTKKSCCIESPFDMITTATIAPVPHQPSGKIKFQDAICEYKTFGVEFTHPKDHCKICTCELQGRVIVPLCKRSPKPECHIPNTMYPTPTAAIEFQGSPKLPPIGSISYNSGSSSQNKATNNAYVSYQNPYDSSIQSMGSSQSTADATSYNWNYRPRGPGQHYQRPENYQTYGQAPGNLNYGAGFYGNGLGYSQGGQGQPGYQVSGGYPQNYYGGYNHGQGYAGYQTLRPSEVQTQAQFKASASASAAASSGVHSQSETYGYAPGYQYQGQGYPGLSNGHRIQISQNSATAQSNALAKAVTSVKYKGRSGNPDDNESTEKEQR